VRQIRPLRYAGGILANGGHAAAQGDDLAKNVYMEQLHDRNEVLYYRVLRLGPEDVASSSAVTPRRSWPSATGAWLAA
jgi:hypothetical protein